MSRCIVFDPATARAVQSHLRIRPEIRTDQPGTILEIVENSRAVVAVAPATEPGNVLLIRVTRQERTQTPEKTPSNLAPAGILGLTDSIDMDSEPEQPKKWWRKIIG